MKQTKQAIKRSDYDIMIMRSYLDKMGRLRFKFDPNNDDFVYYPSQSSMLRKMTSTSTYVLKGSWIAYEKENMRFVDGQVVIPEPIDKDLLKQYTEDTGFVNTHICKFRDNDNQFAVLCKEGTVRYVVQINGQICKSYQVYVGSYNKAIEKYGFIVSE